MLIADASTPSDPVFARREGRGTLMDVSRLQREISRPAIGVTISMVPR